MHNRSRFILAFAVIVAFGAATAQAEWYDGFESYPVGGGLHGLGGWAGWNNDPAADALVSDLYAFTGTQSVAVSGATDIVQQFSGYSTGLWNLVSWMYMPTDFTGQTYYILLNTYAPNGAQNWSVQVSFSNGQVLNEGAAGGSLPWVLGQWVELRLEIDLINNIQTFYYNGTVLFVDSWTEGMSGGGALNIGALDLYANSASPVYYDEFSLTQGGVATETKTWSQVKGLFE
ncbi:MAG TPA: hypothetical protein PLL30_15135 [Candidatus Krumholzibacteria bacterium]|nr:hypothetical protein [Candidatus Krumholzibacteria bacterium]HPD73104.1 hypothetical protein [Candidatus Krumholzibacteria bacterium]HRY41904.1 hypothetical protein [Candidatus Krumholzibacteria bacterium]